MLENTDQNNSGYGDFSRSVWLLTFFSMENFYERYVHVYHFTKLRSLYLEQTNVSDSKIYLQRKLK